jgi:hypothetical protein
MLLVGSYSSFVGSFFIFLKIFSLSRKPTIMYY